MTLNDDHLKIKVFSESRGPKDFYLCENCSDDFVDFMNERRPPLVLVSVIASISALILILSQIF
jgi:hypothetical protein